MAWSRSPEERVHTMSAGFSRVGKGRERVGPETWFDLASLTKPLVVTTLFLLARREGLLRLDSRVGLLIPEIRTFSDVTIEHILTHTGGFPAWEPLYASGYLPNEILSAIDSLKPIGLPGSRFEYSCPGFILLGLILQKVLGMDLDEAFEVMVAGPLGLGNHLSFNPSVIDFSVAGGALEAGAETQLLKMRGDDPLTIPPWSLGLPDDGNARFLGGVAGNAGLFGTVFGVVSLGREYFREGGRLLTADEADLAARCRTVHLGRHRALGWQLASSPGCSAGPGLSPASIGHVGFTGTSVWIDRRKGCVMAFLANRHHPAHHWLDFHPLRRRFNWLVCMGQSGNG